MTTCKLLLLIASSLLFFYSCTKSAEGVRDNLVGDWQVDTKFSYLKDNKEISSSVNSFFLNLRDDGTGIRNSINRKDTLDWAYVKSPESVLIAQSYGSGFTPSATKFLIVKNDANSQIWEINTRRFFYIDTASVLTDYRETWKLERR